MLVQTIGVVSIAARARRQACRKERQARTRVVRGMITYRSPDRRVGDLGSTAMTAVPRPDEVFASHPSPSSVGTDGLDAIVDARHFHPDSGPTA